MSGSPGNGLHSTAEPVLQTSTAEPQQLQQGVDVAPARRPALRRCLVTELAREKQTKGASE